MYKVETNPDKFEFEVNGIVYKIPKMQDLPLMKFRELQQRIRDTKDELRAEEAVYALLDVFEELAPGSTKDLTYMQAAQLVRAYTTGTDELGES